MNIVLNLDTLNGMPMDQAWAYNNLDRNAYLEGGGNWAAPAGWYHYRLLAYIGGLYNGVRLADVGTSTGGSAFALAVNERNSVYSLDRVQCRHSTEEYVRNIHFVVDDFHKPEVMDEIAKAEFISFDIQHEGPDEHYFYNELIRRNWQGIMLVDDITLNDPMREFWASITHRKYDVTSYGHGENRSGSGLVIFNPQTTIELR